MTRLKILQRDLPSDKFRFEFDPITGKGIAIYYDYLGATFCEKDEVQIVYDYLIDVIEKHFGFKIRITEWGSSNNGHFADHFERA